MLWAKRRTKGWIKKTGHQNEKGQYTAEFGPLFTAVQGDMQALSGTLKTARRLGVVGFEGEHLMQGRDDKVLITLLDDSDKKYNIVVSDKGARVLLTWQGGARVCVSPSVTLVL